MDLKKIGEFGLISIIQKRFEGMQSGGVEGIGDDCAVIPKDDLVSYVVTTDMLVEGKHFLLDKISPYELGYKSLAVNLSDVAAMGATPRFSFLSFALPSTISKEWCEDFVEGYHFLSSEQNVLLLGGDTTSAADGNLTISVTAIGEVPNCCLKRRSDAKVGDVIAVTTHLGDSAAALRLILAGDKMDDTLLKKHNMPRPNNREGIWLGQRTEVRAMMDISDGVASDIEHICQLSSCGAEIFCDKIPHSNQLMELVASKKWSILDLSLSGGEDYGLLLTVEGESFETVRNDALREIGCQLYPIGVITSSGRVVFLNADGETVDQNVGFRHF